MGQRKVYIDFIDGNGYIDISDFVKYDTLSIQEMAFNDTFHAAQNTCSFSVIYDASIYTKITTNTKNLPLRIFDLRDGAVIHTEADQPILTESGMRLLIETSVAVPVFAGHIPPKSSREYNGILDNTIIKINAVDNLDYMDVAVGDVLYANCAVMNPSDPANSIVHKLALIAGWTTSMVSSVSIPTVIARYSPSDEKATVRSILDTLLYEYGYTLFLNENDDLAPIQWDRSIPSGTIPEFNEDNIIDEISIDNSTQKYDGVKVIYYDLNSVNNMRLYRDSNCGYASDGSFAGYSISSGTDYPPAANAIDETTGNKQIVYQEYTDDAIKYATNKAIQQNLDYNYKNYDSDFTSIVATENHYVDRRFQSPITVVTEAFANKKCRLLYRNTTGSPVLLYYNDVYATIWYKSAEHTAIKDIATTPSDVYEYTSSYIFSKAVGDELALAIAAQYKNGLRTYEHTSEKDFFCGDMVKIILSGEGTDTYALIQNKVWDEKNELYTYTCLSYNPTRETLTSQNVVEVGAINSAESYASVHSIGTPEAVTHTIQPMVAEYNPKYLGVGILAGLTTKAFTGATVNGNGVITVGTAITPNTGDWMVNYSAVNVPLGMYVWGTSAWAVSSNVELISAAAIDLCNLQVGGITIDGFTTFTTAIIKTLFAQQIKLLDNGKLYSGAGNFNNTDTPLYMDANGNFSIKDICYTDQTYNELNFRGNICVGGSIDPRGTRQSEYYTAVTTNGKISTNGLIIDRYRGLPSVISRISKSTVYSVSSTAQYTCCYMGNSYIALMYKEANSLNIEIRILRLIDGAFVLTRTTTIATDGGVRALQYMGGMRFAASSNSEIRVYDFDASGVLTLLSTKSFTGISGSIRVCSVPSVLALVVAVPYSSGKKLEVYTYSAGVFTLRSSRIETLLSTEYSSCGIISQYEVNPGVVYSRIYIGGFIFLLNVGDFSTVQVGTRPNNASEYDVYCFLDGSNSLTLFNNFLESTYIQLGHNIYTMPSGWMQNRNITFDLISATNNQSSTGRKDIVAISPNYALLASNYVGGLVLLKIDYSLQNTGVTNIS